MMRGSAGGIITFYSYKGGTGRTMALSNLAWVLASNDKHVLLIDWDLEAPGLHRYLRPFLVDPELRSTPGLIDFVWDIARDKLTPTKAKTSGSNFTSLEDYVVGLDWRFNGSGSISFIPAGRQDENYAQRVNTFDWDNFYERLGGGKLLRACRDELRSTYDYILIDSRTGVSDTSGICTVDMPDALVICFTLNYQSIVGAASVASSVQKQRGPEFQIFPIPTRIENAETEKLEAALKFAREKFAPFLLRIQKDKSKPDLEEQQSYWNAVQTPYRTFYAFEEVPATFKDSPGARGTVLDAIEQFAAIVSNGEVTKLIPDDESRRRSVIAKYSFSSIKSLTDNSFEFHAARFSLGRYFRLLKGIVPYVMAVIIGAVLSWSVARVFTADRDESLNKQLQDAQYQKAELQGKFDELNKQVKLQQHQNSQSQDTVSQQNSELLKRIQDLTTQLKNQQNINQQQQNTLQTFITEIAGKRPAPVPPWTPRHSARNIAGAWIGKANYCHLIEQTETDLVVVNFDPGGQEIGRGSGRVDGKSIELNYVLSGQKEQANLMLSDEGNVLSGKTVVSGKEDNVVSQWTYNGMRCQSRSSFSGGGPNW